jgi:hypothetical protein
MKLGGRNVTVTGILGMLEVTVTLQYIGEGFFAFHEPDVAAEANGRA